MKGNPRVIMRYIYVICYRVQSSGDSKVIYSVQRRPGCGRLFALRGILDVALVNGGVIFGVVGGGNSFYRPLDSSPRDRHMFLSFFSELIQLVTEEAMASNGSPIGGSGERSDDAYIQRNKWVTLCKTVMHYMRTMFQQESRGRSDTESTTLELKIGGLFQAMPLELERLTPSQHSHF